MFTTVGMCRRPQKFDTNLANEISGQKINFADLRHIFGSNTSNEKEGMLRREGPQQLHFACNIVFTFSLTIKYNFSHTPDRIQSCLQHRGSGAALFSRFCNAKIWKQYNYWTLRGLINCQRLNNLQLGRLLKTFFLGVHIEFKDMIDERILFKSTGMTLFALIFRQTSIVRFQQRTATLSLLQKSGDSIQNKFWSTA